MIQGEFPLNDDALNAKVARRLNNIGMPDNSQTRPFVVKLFQGATLIWVRDRQALMVVDKPISRIVSKG